jgi:hypothetical protein
MLEMGIKFAQESDSEQNIANKELSRLMESELFQDLTIQMPTIQFGLKRMEIEK